MTQHGVFYPSRNKSEAVFGYNAQLVGGADDTQDIIDLAVAGGATILRFGIQWRYTENYATGALSLGVNETGLDLCQQAGVTPMVVAAYGPPFSTTATLTVATGGAGIGEYEVTVDESVASVDPPYCHITKSDNSHVVASGKRNDAGALIDSVNTGTKTLTLAAPLTVALLAGDTIKVNRLRYPSLATDTDPAVDAYADYVAFLAEKIDEYGGGYICVWNEMPWTADPWHRRARFYESPDGALTASDKGYGLLAACAALDLPESVKLINGCSDLWDEQGLLQQGITDLGNFAYDGIHPYGLNPESSGWDQGRNDGTKYQTLDPNADPEAVGHNFEVDYFAKLAYVNDQSDETLGLFATECGESSTTDARQATWLLRRVISLWGMGVPAIVYTFNYGGDRYFAVAPGLVTRPSYDALKRLIEVVGRIDDGVGGLPPSVAAFPYSGTGQRSGDWEAVTVPLTGAYGHSVIFAYLRTRVSTAFTGDIWTEDSPNPWDYLSTPAAQNLTITAPDGTSVAEAINLRTGDTVTTTPGANGSLTAPVGEDPIAIRFEPA